METDGGGVRKASSFDAKRTQRRAVVARRRFAISDESGERAAWGKVSTSWCTVIPDDKRRKENYKKEVSRRPNN